jgi:hypothetical protein
LIAAADACRSVAGAPAACGYAAAATVQAAHAAASAWHLTSTVSEESRKGVPREERTAEARKFLGGLEHVEADLAALNAFTAAADAFTAVGYRNEDFVAAALNDYDALVRLRLGRYPEPGAPVDPSRGGPLGPL